VRFVDSALHVFADDVAHHRRRRCKRHTRAVLPVPGSRR
jgi:hypothetical protein